MPNAKLEHSKPLDVYLWGDIPAIKGAADFIYRKMKRECGYYYDGKQLCIPYKSGSLNGAKILDKLKVILVNLYIAYQQDNRLYLSFSRSSDNYKKNKRNPQVFLNKNYVVFVTDFLAKHKYIELHLGVYSHVRNNFSRWSRMKATYKLVREFRKYRQSNGMEGLKRRIFPIILRDANKNDIYFPLNTFYARQLVININKINRILKRHIIEIPAKFLENDEIGRRSYQQHYQSYNQSYYRVFNDGSLNFDAGGRFYCHWSQQIKSEYRKFITIDGEPCVELDYSCLHISMLYALRGKSLPDGDLYELPGIPDDYRKLVKLAVNIYINVDSKKKAISALNKYGRAFYKKYPGLPFIKCRTIFEAIENKHNDIRDDFAMKKGSYLQSLDSKIAENIMLHFAARDIPVLCIHDSFVIQARYKDELYKMMNEEYHKVFHRYPKGITFKSNPSDEGDYLHQLDEELSEILCEF